MAQALGFRGQRYRDVLFDASGTVTAGGASQLVLPEALSRSWLFIENLSTTLTLYYEIGAAFATATIVSGAVTALTVVNGGFGFTVAPTVQFLGGGRAAGALAVGAGLPDYPSPGLSIGQGQTETAGNRPAQARAVLTAGIITSFVIDDPGAGYLAAPYVFISNSPRDPVGCADPFYGSVARGMGLLPFGSQTFENSFITTQPLAVYSATTGHRFTVKYFAG